MSKPERLFVIRRDALPGMLDMRPRYYTTGGGFTYDLDNAAQFTEAGIDPFTFKKVQKHGDNIVALEDERTTISKGNFELVPSFPAEKEKQLAAVKKNGIAYAKGYRRSVAQTFGYAFLFGREYAIAKELLGHGQLTTWAEENLCKPAGITLRYAQTLHKFYDAAKNELSSFLPPAGKVLLLAPLKKKFTAKEEEKILDLLPKAMDGKTITEVARGTGIIPDKQPDGGFRPNAERLAEWLKETHPDLADTKWFDLPQKIKREFIESGANEGKRRTREEIENAAFLLASTNWLNTLSSHLRVGIEEKLYTPCNDEQIDALKAALHDLHTLVVEFSKQRKAKRK